MSTYVLMRILESAPRRYDLGIRLLTLGSVDRAYDRLVNHIGAGQQVLDIGCGTGALTVRAGRQGAIVKGIDISAQMLEIARRRVVEAGFTDTVEVMETGVAELDGEAAEHFDVVTSGLCFSELSDEELAYTLTQVKRILRPGGLLLVADEIRPSDPLRRAVLWLIRAPLVALTYVITQQTTHPASDLAKKITAAGLSLVSVRHGALGSFGEYVARKPESEAA